MCAHRRQSWRGERELSQGTREEDTEWSMGACASSQVRLCGIAELGGGCKPGDSDSDLHQSSVSLSETFLILISLS